MRLFKYLTIFILLSISSTIIQAQTWTQLLPNGTLPMQRYWPSTVYDPTNNRMIIFGGNSFDTINNVDSVLNDVWVLGNANGLNGTPTWTQLTITGNAPSPRYTQTAVYDSLNNLMTVFGGGNGSTGFNDVWTLSHANGLGGTPSWTQLTVSSDSIYGNPPADPNTGVYDFTHNRMIIFEGDQNNNDMFLNEVWTLSNANGLDSTISTWKLISMFVNNTALSRVGEYALYDEKNNIMAVFGGQNYNGYLNDVWTLSNANGLDTTIPTWTQLTILGDAPMPRGYFGGTYDDVHNQMMIFGGFTFGFNSSGGAYAGLFNDTWVLNNANGLGETSSWKELTPAGIIPQSREMHTAVYDTIQNRIIIFGGLNNSGNILDDVWVLSDANGLLPAPNYSNIPSLKLFTNQSINNAFTLEDYNSGGVADTYSIVSNFLDLSSLTGSSVNQAGYASATVGLNTYQGSNTLGSSTVSNKVKYSTYKIYELPQVGLSVGNWWDVKVGHYTYNTDGLAVPPSFGNPDALIVSDTTSISATWLNNTVIHITSLQSFSGAVNVDVIASSNATSPFGSDIDKERIEVYSNLLQNGTFSSASDTTAWGLQTVPENYWLYNNLATQTWLESTTDSVGNTAFGVWQFIFTNTSCGVQATPFSTNYIPVTQGKWYISRMRIADATAGNGDIAMLFSFSQRGGYGYTSDISADVITVGIPTTWTWMEAPFYVHASTIGNTAFPQFQFRARGAGSVFIDEVQIIQATPRLLEGTRGNTRSFVPGGLFTNAVSSTLWGEQGYYNPNTANEVTSPPAFTLTSDTAIGSVLSANFAGAGNGSYQLGFVWTYGNMTGGITTPAVTVGREYGATMQMNIVNGLSDKYGLSIARINVYNIPANGVHTPLDKIEGAAEVGVLVSGTLTTVGIASDPYAQLQFGVRADTSGILDIANVDLISDTNDPNFGDAALFP